MKRVYLLCYDVERDGFIRWGNSVPFLVIPSTASSYDACLQILETLDIEAGILLNISQTSTDDFQIDVWEAVMLSSTSHLEALSKENVLAETDLFSNWKYVNPFPKMLERFEEERWVSLKEKGFVK